MTLLVKLLLAVVLSAQLVLAFPGMGSVDLNSIQDQLFPRSFHRINRPRNKRQSGDPFLNLPTLTIPGLLQPVSVLYPGGVTVGRKGFPDSAHPFQNPPSGAQRGGCPGLNLLANYGYISRSGITNAGELLFAMQEAMGFAPDLAGALIALSLRGMTDPTTLKMSIGGTDSRTSGLMSWLFGGTVPGLFSAQSHSRYEHDGSLAHYDAYFTPGGTTSRFNGTLWKQRRQSADNDFNGLFSLEFISQARFDSYNYCFQNNPQCSWVIVSQLLFYGAENLLWLHFPSSNTDGTVGLATAGPVETFSGIVESTAGVFTKVPEKFPVGSDGKWYRRGLAEGVTALIETYAAHPVAFGVNSGTTNSFVAQGDLSNSISGEITVKSVSCLILTEIAENVPASVSSLIQATVGDLVDALLAPAFVGLDC